MISRTLDAALLNRVANHPEVRPWLLGEGELDLAPLVEDARNYALVTEHGGFVYRRIEDGLYEVHSQILPEGRRHSLQAARASLRFMFTRTNAAMVTTQVPDANRAAMGLTRTVGFKRVGRRNDTSFWSLPLDVWCLNDPGLDAVGERFHEALEGAKRAAGSALPTHEDDVSHNRVVGAAVLMAEAGQVSRGCWLYNRWAATSGYELIEQISPTVVDVRDALVGFDSGKLEVLRCR